MQLVAAAIDLVDKRDLGRALQTVGRISQLSRTPFASKVVAFICPSRMGIYDNRIRKALAAPEVIAVPPIARWLTSMVVAHDISRGVGPVQEARVQRRFVNWCGVLTEAANALNELGSDIMWTDPELGAQEWRAMDVERAIFQATAHGRQGCSSARACPAPGGLHDE